MAEVINMPKLGFDMAEGILVRWIKAEDEQVNKGEVLAEIETDKATVEVESIKAEWSGNISSTRARQLLLVLRSLLLEQLMRRSIWKKS